MADRLEARGGTLAVRSRPGEGMVIAGRIPARRTLLHIGRRYLRSDGRPPENGAPIMPTSRSRGSDAVVSALPRLLRLEGAVLLALAVFFYAR
jgi:hypothetical protein